jgi:hypothetical protein
MTQEILDHLDDVLNELKRLSKEINSSMEDDVIDENTYTELEGKVYEPLISLIDDFDKIIETVNKLDDIDFFNDPYNEGLED